MIFLSVNIIHFNRESIRRVLSRLIIILFLFFSSPLLHAGTEVYKSSLTGTGIVANTTLSVADLNYDVSNLSSNTGIREQRVRNTVTLWIDHSTPGVVGNISSTVKFTVQYTDEFGEEKTIPDLVLSVGNQSIGNDPYTDRRSYHFEGGHLVNILITEVTGVHSSLKLDNVMQVDRLYHFSYTAPVLHSLPAFPDELGEYTVSWDGVPGAEEYQLEWLHVNSYNGLELPYDFSSNATRITTRGTEYKVSSLFEKGYVLFRVRALTYESLDRRYALTGKWSCEASNECSGVNASGYSKKITIEDEMLHTGDRLNWQYISNYAEDGKKKEVVTYYDGTMRSHQAVTRLNTDNNIIVGETYYDRQGRAAVQSLPVPVVDPEEEKSLRFYRDFNKNAQGSAYSRINFDKGEVPCELSAEEMLNTSGASMYYSDRNPDRAGINQYLPDSEGYPFSQMEYTADNTGRIKRQGGVGADYQLGSHHETRYLYSTPNQDELNSLFGGEAGYSSHYKKNTVIDANGQLSISYMDMYGRVVATALTGTPATGLSGLSSFETAQDTVINILNNRPAAAGNFFIRNTYFHTVTTAAPQTFEYLLGDIRFDLEGNLSTGICLDCMYDLTIDIVDECGIRPQLEGNEQLPVTRTAGALGYVCGSSESNGKLNFSFTTRDNLEIGTYAISRTLSVNKGALEANTTRYVDSISGIPKLKELVEAEKAKADLDGCREPDCEEKCLLSLGANPSYEDFMRCKVDCEYFSECTTLEDLLASDFMPGIKMEGSDRFEKSEDAGKPEQEQEEQVMGGQYALYAVNDGIYSAGDEFSVFYTNLDDLYNRWGEPFIDESVTPNPTQSDKIRVLVENFRPEWSKELVSYHPEKCRLDACKASEASGSLKYDYLMSITETYEEAYRLGLLNPLGMTSNETGIGFPENQPRDPFFQSGGPGAASLDQMKYDLRNDIIHGNDQIGDQHLSIWRKAVLLSGVCKSFEGQPVTPATVSSCLDLMNNYVLAPLDSPQMDICSRDRVWTFFRALYRAKKEQVKMSLPAPDGCSPVDSRKRKRFPENDDLFSEDELDVISTNGSDMSKIEALMDNAESDMQSMCELQAKAQIDNIMEELSQCKVNVSSGLVVWDSTSTAYKQVQKAFIDIMVYTCDMTSIFGSSDIPEELIAGKPDSIEYVSFDAALKGILGEQHINLDCNADLVSFPGKSGREYPDLVAYKLLDSCGCARLLSADDEYREKKANNRFPVNISTGRKYFEAEYGFSIDNYQSKVCLCRNEMPNPVNLNERLAQWGEFIPRGISCETCVDCETIKTKLTEFENSRLFLVGYNNLFQLVAQDQIRNLTLQQIIENYLNNELSQNKNYGEYHAFLNGCYQIEEVSDGYVCSETPDVRAQRLVHIIESTIKEPVSGECLPVEVNPDVRAVFPELSDNSCHSYLYDVVATADTSLSIFVYTPPPGIPSSCGVKVRFADHRDLYRYENIIHIDKNSIRRSPETSLANNRLFLVDATIDHGGKLVSATLEIEACFPVFTCYNRDNQSDYTLCPREQAPHRIPEGDCAEILILTAMKNAERIYETLLDSTVTAFRTDYSRRCLTTTGREQLNMSFKANDRHYTLYYYDQAGNLVRTIPPEGVVLVDKSQFERINEDRQNDTMTVFTQHRMETRYLYNSLNQLTHQYMPDHESFEDISLVGRNSGLPSNLNIDAMSFTGSDGVLFGTTPASNGQSQGYVTGDGGASWTPVTDLGINNLNGLCKIPGTTTLCIVGDKGTLLKSQGSSWITVNTRVQENIVWVNFTDSNNGYFFTASGKVYQTVNGGDAWNPVSTIGLSRLENVYFSSPTIGYAVGYSGGEGAVYTTADGGEIWHREYAVASDLTQVQMVNDQTAYALDDRGILLRMTSTGSGWDTRVVASQTRPNFRKMHFTSEGMAVALTAEEGYLRVSLDGGVGWNAPDGPEEQSYLDMSFAGTTVYLLSGDNRVFKRHAFDSFSTQEEVTLVDFTGSLKTICFEDAATGYVAGDGGAIYYTTDGGLFWTELIPDAQFGRQDITTVYSSPSDFSPVVHVVTSDKKLYRGQVHIQADESTVEFSQVPLDGAEVKSSAFNASGKGYVLSTEDKVYTNARNVGGTWEHTGTVSGSIAVALSPDNPLNAFSVGTGGQIFSTDNAFAGNSTTGQRVSLANLMGVSAQGTAAVAAGNSGTVILRNSAGQWEILPAPFTSHLRRVAVGAGGRVTVASTAGVLYSNDNPDHNVWTGIDPPLTTALINDLTYAGSTLLAGSSNGIVYRRNGAQIENLNIGDHSINAILQDGTAAWAVGDGGSVYRLGNFAAGTDWQWQGTAVATRRITSTCQIPSGGYFATTVDGFIGSSANGSSWEFSSNPLTGNPLHVVRFFNDNTGLAAGEGAVLRTLNGGDTWTLVAGVSQTFNDICFVSATKAFLVGDNGSIYTLEGSGLSSLSPKASPVTTRLNSIHFHNSTGYIAGDNGVILKIEDGEEEWTALTAPNGNDWTTYTDPATGVTRNLNSVTVIDQRTAYVSGDHGIILKTIDGGVTWNRKESGTTSDLTQLAFDGSRTAVFSGTGATVMRMADNSDRFSSRFYYDKLGRLVASQNSKQQAMDPPRYSYTHYDAQGRVTQVGEMAPNSDRILTEDLLSEPNFADLLTQHRYQVTRTQYDAPLTDEVSRLFTGGVQQRLRNRVASALYQEIYSRDSTVYDHATHYSYDIHGNVKELVQDNTKLKNTSHQYKKLVYEYDLISGNVNRVIYQPGMSDQLFHKYEYDADNRIRKVYSSLDGFNWDRDANYQYYKHGPLARTELGDLKIQGIDYAYTLQGWIKGVNSNQLSADNDMGGDGKSGSPNSGFAEDAFGYSLHYNANDYRAIGGSSSEGFLSAVSNGADMTNLYNGNISRMATAISENIENSSALNLGTQVRDFRYDELNRLISSNKVSGKGAADAYATTYSYDANGNIKNLTRNGNAGAMDNLTYHYTKDGKGNIISNRLLHVNDLIDADIYDGIDIDNQGDDYAQNDPATHNYKYDRIGNLIADKQDSIAEIVWNVQGKVQKIIRAANCSKPELLFSYDAFGNRVSKTQIYPAAIEDVKEVTTYYVHDARKNVMAVYNEKKYADGKIDLSLTEQHLYGSSRIGMRQVNSPLVEKGIENDVNLAYSQRKLGEKSFEMTNHLGNILAVVSDKKLPNNEPDVKAAYDYYPFGMQMPGRTLSGDYRFGFGGHEKDDELKSNGNHISFGNYGYDPRLGRRFGLDPVDQIYISNYAAFANNPIIFIDTEGRQVEYTLQQIDRVWGEFEQGYYALGNALKEAVLTIFSYTDVNDAVVLGSTVIPGVTAVNVNGAPATVVDKTFAFMGAFIPVVSGSTIKGVAKEGIEIGGEFIQRNFQNLEKIKNAAWYKYQEQINGISGSFEFLLGNVRFDGYKDGVLLEAKGFYQQIFKKYGERVQTKIFDNMTKQLKKQVDAADGLKLEWHFAEQETMEQFTKHLKGVEGGSELLEKVTMTVTKYDPQ